MSSKGAFLPLTSPVGATIGRVFDWDKKWPKIIDSGSCSSGAVAVFGWETKVFSFTTGVSPKVVNESGGAQGQALRKLPATPENMTKLSAFEHAAANAPGAATSADKIAAAGYLPDHIENISSNFS
ncbi:hypothetical protein [Paraburkholderia bryophila]|uniref:Uncharacterized protein n=1 Tax=Paraburkholderia bryophila TaxID=420952 RepID=A0A7Z0B1C3_9BURK|nr:hypothetical protein [Paraburkholderia bryophila]NYH16728.1 hypothetical protein [Paraburkholderia bryophila]